MRKIEMEIIVKPNLWMKVKFSFNCLWRTSLSYRAQSPDFPKFAELVKHGSVWNQYNMCDNT